MKRFPGHGKNNQYLPKVCVGEDIIAAIEELMNNYGMCKSDAIRGLLTLGALHMVLEGPDMIIPQKEEE